MTKWQICLQGLLFLRYSNWNCASEKIINSQNSNAIQRLHSDPLSARLISIHCYPQQLRFRGWSKLNSLLLSNQHAPKTNYNISSWRYHLKLLLPILTIFIKVTDVLQAVRALGLVLYCLLYVCVKVMFSGILQLIPKPPIYMPNKCFFS